MSRLLVFLLLACGCHSNDGTPDLSATHDLAAGADDLAIASDLFSSSDAPPPLDLYNPDGCAGTCDGACVALDSDPNHCGSCGHVCGCGSTSCTNGVCDPVVLAPNLSAPYVVARQGDKVWWGADGSMTFDTVPIAGGAVTTFCPGRTAIRGIDFDATNVYFTRFLFNIIEESPQTSCSGGNYTNTQESGASGITHDATNLYWADYAMARIRTTTFATPRSPISLATAQLNASQIANDAANVYWTTNQPGGGVWQLAKSAPAGTLPTALATGQASPFGLAVDATRV